MARIQNKLSDTKIAEELSKTFHYQKSKAEQESH
jgi:hypothetical protein